MRYHTEAIRIPSANIDKHRGATANIPGLRATERASGEERFDFCAIVTAGSVETPAGFSALGFTAAGTVE